MRILSWLCSALSEQKWPQVEPLEIAESVLTLYRDALREEMTPDGLRVISWLDDAPETVSLPWLNLVVFLHQRDLATTFVVPNGIDFNIRRRSPPIQFESMSEETKAHACRELSQAWLRKVRLHIRILVGIHEAMDDAASSPIMSFTPGQRDSLLGLVEDRLRSLVTAQLASGHRSLFELDKDVYGGSKRSAPSLLKLIIRTFNRFSGERREATFAEWMRVEADPTVILTVLNDAVSMEAKHCATSELQRVDLDHFLAKQWAVTQMEQVAEAAAMIPEQTSVVEKILAYGETIVRNAYRPKWDEFAYRMRLMVAYHRKDVAELERIPAPVTAEGQRTDVNGTLMNPPEDTRSFYRALLLIEDHPDQAHKIFDDLLQRHPGSAAHAVNRFSASVKAAGNTGQPDERRRAFLQALRDWTVLESSIPAGAIADVKDNVAYLRLACFDGANHDGEFDAAWTRLDATQWAQLEFIALFVDNARRRGLPDQIEQLLAKARPYHVGLNHKIAEPFARLLLQVEAGDAAVPRPAYVVSVPGDDIEIHQRYFRNLRHFRAEDVVRIVGKQNASLQDFLTDILCDAAGELLERIAIWANVDGENQRNDLMVSFLKMRLRFLGWHVPDQSRGGLSESGKDAGERDWLVCDSAGTLAIFEALRLSYLDKTEIGKHVTKAISKSRYNPAGVVCIYLIVYYEGKSWPEFWKNYISHVRALVVDGTLPTQQPTRDRNASIRTERHIYDNDSGMPIHVCHMVMEMPP